MDLSAMYERIILCTDSVARAIRLQDSQCRRVIQVGSDCRNASVFQQ